MTVNDLRKILDDMNDDAKVFVGFVRHPDIITPILGTKTELGEIKPYEHLKLVVHEDIHTETFKDFCDRQ